jgi:hypothetical protein
MIESIEKILKIVGLYWVPASYVDEIEDYVGSISIKFYPGRAIEEIKFASAIFGETPSETVNGTLYKQKLEIVMAGDTSVLRKKLKEIKDNKPIFLIEYDNSTFFLLGDKYNYCQLSDSFESENFESKNTISITRQSPNRAMFLA